MVGVVVTAGRCREEHELRDELAVTADAGDEHQVTAGHGLGRRGGRHLGRSWLGVAVAVAVAMPVWWSRSPSRSVPVVRRRSWWPVWLRHRGGCAGDRDRDDLGAGVDRDGGRLRHRRGHLADHGGATRHRGRRRGHVMVVAAVCAATLFPVIATMPVGLDRTFSASSSRSATTVQAAVRGLDERNFLVARTTTPRWAANSRAVRHELVERAHRRHLGQRGRATADWIRPQMLSAELSACCSLIVWWKFSVNPAESSRSSPRSRGWRPRPLPPLPRRRRPAPRWRCLGVPSCGLAVAAPVAAVHRCLLTWTPRPPRAPVRFHGI